MKKRCYIVSNRNYHNYGGRGIKICKEWLNNHRAFEEWAYDNGYKSGLTIDRINPDKDYCPDNCRWITLSENSKWTRRTYRIWINNYCNTARGWSLTVHKSRNWFSTHRHRKGYDYAYQRLLEEIEKLGGIKKVMGVEEEPDISRILEDIESDCLEVDP